MRKNLFIALEGIDGSGKSTQAKLLGEKLASNGHKIYHTVEPTNGPIGRIIRDIFQHKMEADHRTIAGLFIADRLEHILHKTDGILQKLDEGFTVITDRYYFSSYAYQGVHMDLDWVILANTMSSDLLRPDINIFIDASPENCMKRIAENRNTVELYESLDNLIAVREMYFAAFEKLKEKENICLINGDGSVGDIAKAVWDKILVAGK